MSPPELDGAFVLANIFYNSNDDIPTNNACKLIVLTSSGILSPWPGHFLVGPHCPPYSLDKLLYVQKNLTLQRANGLTIIDCRGRRSTDSDMFYLYPDGWRCLFVSVSCNKNVSVHNGVFTPPFYNFKAVMRPSIKGRHCVNPWMDCDVRNKLSRLWRNFVWMPLNKSSLQ